MNNKPFEVEGIGLRLKQTPVTEVTIPQNSSRSVDYTKIPNIFLNEDGRLYFKDNNLKNPISLGKIQNYYDRIKTVEGELRFYNSDLSRYVTLSQMLAASQKATKDNSVLYSSNKRVTPDENFDSYIFLSNSYDGYYEELPSINAFSDVNDVLENFRTAFMDTTVSSLSGTPFEFLYNNFVYGACVDISGGTLGLSGDNGLFFGQTFSDAEKCILTDKRFFCNDAYIGFISRDTDDVGKKIYAEKSLGDFNSDMFYFLYKFNDIGKYIEYLFGENGYFDIFTGTDCVLYSKVILEELSTIISSRLFERYMAKFNDILRVSNVVDSRNLFYSEKIYKELFPIEDDRKGFEYYLSMTDASIRSSPNRLKTDINNAISFLKTGEILYLTDMSDYRNFPVGGQFTERKTYLQDLSKFNETWFDIDGMYIATPKVSNEVGISVMANFGVDIKHNQKVRYEFRLIDTVSLKELDRILIEGDEYTAIQRFGNIYKDRVETYPIQLSYFGPIPKVNCSLDIVRKCSGVSDLDVRTHVRVNAGDIISEDTVPDNFKVITDRIESVIPNLKKDDTANTKELDAPRIFRVQWRCIVPIANGVSSYAHNNMVSNMTFNKNTPRSDLFDISVGIYQLGNMSQKRILKQGVETFKENRKKRVEIPLLTTLQHNDYSISMSCSKNIKLWYEDKTLDGFTIVAEKKFTGEVSWLVSKQPNYNIIQEANKNNNLPTCIVDYTPAFSNKSNYDIFKEFGYAIDILSSTVSISG